MKHIDLYCHSSAGKESFLKFCTKSKSWLEDGRPRELHSLPLTKWVVLTTGIKEYHCCLTETKMRVVKRMILPSYMMFFVAMVVSMATAWPSLMSFAMYGLFTAIFLAAVVAKHFEQRHVDEIFNPSVQDVVKEMGPAVAESGWDMKLMVNRGTYFPPKPTVSFLRFTPRPVDGSESEDPTCFSKLI